MNSNYRINRRTLLRGVGATLALPMLDIMTPAARAKSTSGAKPPIRLGILYKGNGVHPASWDIGGTSETDFELSPLVKGLEPVRDKVLFLSNLYHASGGWSHQGSATAFLTSEGAKGGIDRPQATSIDQIIAEKIGGKTPLKSLEMTADGIFLPVPIASYISFDGAGRAIPRESDAQIVFDRMFRGFASPGQIDRNRSVLDAVSDDASSLRRRASQADRNQLDAYFDAVRSAELRLEKVAGAAAGEGRWQPPTKPNITRPNVAGNLPERMKALLDMMVLAFWTDTTRVSSLIMANSNSRIVLDFLGIQEEHHYLSHFVRNRGTSFLTNFNQITDWYVRQLAYLVQRMSEIDEGNGTLLDNTMLLWGSGMKHGDYHSGADLPAILAGGANAGFKTGRWLRYPDQQPWGNLLVSLAERMGVDASGFGSSTEPLAGLDRAMNYDIGINDDGSWVATETNGSIKLRGLLRVSDDLEKPNLYFVRLSNGEIVVINAPFMNLHRKRIDKHVGFVANIEGKSARENGQWVVKEIAAINR